MPHHAADREAAHLGAVEPLEHVVELLGTDDRDDELHAAPACVRTGTAAGGSSRKTSTAPSPSEYASSPCWVMSMPTPSARTAARNGITAPMTFSSTKVAPPLYASVASTPTSCSQSCTARPCSNPS